MDDPREFTIEVRGRVGDYVYQHHSDTKRPRWLWKKPANPRTPRQQAWRAHYANGVWFWYNRLSPAAHEIYDRRAVRIGGTYGRVLFLRDWLKGKFQMETVKSIQKGEAYCNKDAFNVAISPVQVAKSMVIVNSYLIAFADAEDNFFGIEGGQLTSSTNLRIFAKIPDVLGFWPHVVWQVIEYF